MPHLEAVEIARHGTFLLSEQGHYLLHGRTLERVVHLIDGRRTADEIADLAAENTENTGATDVYYAIALLAKHGYVCEAEELDGGPTALNAFWSALGVRPAAAADRLRNRSVRLKIFDGFDDAEARQTFENAGFSVVDADADHTVVLVGDYLDPRLAEINEEQQALGQPWVLAKPTGVVPWIGPVLVPRRTACWQCLASRLRENREVESFLERNTERWPLLTSSAGTPPSTAASLHLVAHQLLTWAGLGLDAHTHAQITTLDLRSLQTERHVLVRRPQCAVCGDRSLGRKPSRVLLVDHAMGGGHAGGSRRYPPEFTYELYRHHVSSITGVVNSLTRTLPAGNPLHSYVAGHNFAMPGNSIPFLRKGLRTRSAGKGTTDAEARTSALCEAVERYSGLFTGDEDRRKATYRELGPAAVDPNACMLFSELQYEQRALWLARHSEFQIVPERFDPAHPIEWSPVWSLTTDTERFLPTGYLYYGYPTEDGAFFYWADSNGNAAGNTLEEAVLQGFLELVERDSVAIWWYNRLPRPAVDLAGFCLSFLDSMIDVYRQYGREFWVLDLTTDTGIPAFAAVNRRIDSPVEDIVLGFGAHLDARTALVRAVTEMNQFIPAVLGRNPDGSTLYTFDDRDSLRWWQNATAANQPYLVPEQGSTPRRPDDFAGSGMLRSAKSAVDHCLDTAARLGLEVLVLDQTRPDVGLSVAKVIVPGLRHFWARYAPGRLYDVPVTMGWQRTRTAEQHLNPIAMFL